ncbi:hypothetical protein [Aeromonas hydrophila]|uniref:hypothetical protein n=1 Tax=Aeromonas hydrophila TaxID=644 RepID=UPI00235F3B7B|nr:hypothetical protein [Aeromonas hydrophila]
MKKHHHLSLIAVLVLSACGGGSDNSNNGDNGAPADITLSGRALSGDYLAGQAVCLDLNANQQCDSGEPQTTTDSQGRFTFTLPEAQKADATQAWAIVATPAAKPQLTARLAKAAPTSTLLGYFDGSGFAISPYTHQLVTSADPMQRKTQYQSSIATKEKQQIASELGLTSQEASAQRLFGDYLASGDAHSIALAEEAAIKEQQLIEARALQAELAASLTISNPQGWTSVHVNIRNLWSHSFHLQTLQHIRQQEIVYSKRVGDIETMLTQGTQWLLEEQGEHNPSLALQRYTSDVSKDWEQKRYREFATWALDYDQDGNASFKGEKASQGTFSQDADGLYSYHTMEFYNEGDPASENAGSRPERTYCDGFDIQAELTRWAVDPSNIAVDHCVGFVEKRDTVESLNAQGTWVNSDTMTEWQKPRDVNSWQVNDQLSPNYHEPRSQRVTAQGDVQRITQYDWHALTLNAPTLGQSPFNVSRDELRQHNGDETIKLSQPLWGSGNKLGNSIASFEQAELQNYNPTRWGRYSDAYLEQDYQQTEDGFTLQSRFFQQDERQPEGIDYPLNLKFAGSAAPFTTQDWQFDNTNQTLTVKHHYQSVADEIVFVLPWPRNLIEGEPMELEASIQLQQSNGLPSATQITSVDGGKAVSTPTFAQGIFSSPLRWAITHPATNPDVQALVKLLFGQAPFAFAANRDTSAQRQCELGQSGTSVQQHLLFAPIGGDMVLNITCHETSGDWVMEQYLLRITEPYNGTSFQADLLDFAEGANIYRDAPTQRYPLTFIKQ